MTSRLRIVLILTAAVLVPGSLVLASGAPAAPAAAAAVAQPPAALPTPAPLCPRTDLPVFLPATALPLANDICGACSDASCQGEPISWACKPGFRCIPGPACSTSGPSCRCLPID